jgi:hypothetical protein
MNRGHTGHIPPQRQTHHPDRHKRLVRHGVDDRAHYSRLLIAPRDVAIDEVGDARIGEEGEGEAVLRR